MRLLYRYLLREYLVWLGYCLGAFFIFWFTFYLFSELDEIQRAHLKVHEAVLFMLANLPLLLSRAVPLSLLLSLLYALNQHVRHNEFTAMRSAGLSLWRLSVPYFAVGVAASLFLLAINEVLMPDSSELAEQILRRHEARGNKAADAQWRYAVNFINPTGGRTWQIKAYNIQSHQMLEPRVFWVTTNGSRHELYAERGWHAAGVWHFTNVQQIIYPAGVPVPMRLQTNLLAMPEFDETPRRIQSEIKINSLTTAKQLRGAALSVAEIIEYQRWHPEKRNDPRLNTKLHVRLAGPWACVAVVFIALPFAGMSARRNVFMGAAAAVIACCGYIVVLQPVCEALGLSGRLIPVLAGWLPNLICMLAGLILVLRVR